MSTVSDAPPSAAPPGDAPPGDAPADAAAPKRRRRLKVGIAAGLVIVLVGAGAGFAVLQAHRRPAGVQPLTPRPITAAARANAVARLGIYPGDQDGPATVVQYRDFATLLGRPIRYAVAFTDERSPDAFKSGAWGAFTQPGGWASLQDGRPRIVLSVALAFGAFSPTPAAGAANLAGIAAGGADGAYQYVANTLVAAGYGDAIIRIGWEFDGNWMPWSAQNDPSAFKAAYRHVHDIFAAASAGFVYDWCGAAGYQRAASAGSTWQGAADWSSYYPGDDVVDTVGLDVYDESTAAYGATSRTWVNPQKVWAAVIPALQVQLAFAQAHGKLVSFPEWGLWAGPTQSATVHGGGDDPTFVQGMFDWMSSLPTQGAGSLSFQAYFNGDPGGTNGLHDLGRFPRSRQLFLNLFGHQAA
jgi:hypothetical protein